MVVTLPPPLTLAQIAARSPAEKERWTKIEEEYRERKRNERANRIAKFTKKLTEVAKTLASTTSELEHCVRDSMRKTLQEHDGIPNPSPECIEARLEMSKHPGWLDLEQRKWAAGLQVEEERKMAFLALAYTLPLGLQEWRLCSTSRSTRSTMTSEIVKTRQNVRVE